MLFEKQGLPWAKGRRQTRGSFICPSFVAVTRRQPLTLTAVTHRDRRSQRAQAAGKRPGANYAPGEWLKVPALSTFERYGLADPGQGLKGRSSMQRSASAVPSSQAVVSQGRVVQAEADRTQIAECASTLTTTMPRQCLGVGRG